jgi:two-component system, NarL family, sensor kinase
MKTRPIIILKLFVFNFIILNFGIGYSQVKNNDSLLKVIAGQPDNTARVDNLILLARNYFLSSKIDSALYRSDEALELSIRLNYIAGQGDAYYLKSSISRVKSDFKTSLNLSEKYLEIYQTLQDSLRLARGYFNLGMLYKDLSDYELAMYYSQKSLSYAIPLKELTMILGNLNCIGALFNTGLSRYDSAASYYLKAFEIAESSGNNAHIASILNNLGDVYFNDKQYEIARNYFTKSLEFSQKNNYTKMLALNYLNLGRVASVESKSQEALDYYAQALKLYTELDDQRGIADINNNFGDTYFWQRKYDLALEYFNRALMKYREMKYIRGIVVSTLNIAAVYSEQGYLEKARSLQDSCIAMAESSGNTALLLQAYRNIADNSFKGGRYENAYTNRLKYDYLNDSLYSIEKSKAINTLILKYEKGKDQARILELEKENLKKTYQRNAYMFTGLGIIVLALFIVVYLRQKSRHEKVVTEQKFRQLEEEKKLMAAKLLVEGQEEERKRIATELHDGLGVLLSATKMQFSTIRDKSPENRELIEKASKMLEQASGDVRKISHNMMPGLLLKLGLYEAVEDLFENLDENENLNASCTISGDHEHRLPENKEIMLYRIIQEMVNNTLKHAEARNIGIQIQILHEAIDIVYSDDGKGFDFNEKMENESIGLKSITSRVNFLNGSLSVDSKPGNGVNYSLNIPV